jgi:hypothetical protein
MLTRRRMRNIGILNGLNSRVSVCLWLTCVRMRRICAWVRHPHSMSMFIVRTRCSATISVALSLREGRPRPRSLGGRCNPSVVKLDRRPNYLSRSFVKFPSMMVSCRSLKTPRYVRGVTLAFVFMALKKLRSIR